MISRIFPYLTDYAWFRRLVWKRIYNKMARSFPTEEWTFMNYGYSYMQDGEGPALSEDDEINRYSIQLYHSLISRVDYHEKSVLEVGSGRGGGANYIASNLSVKKMTGMDIAASAVNLCNRTFKNKALEYVEGNSEKMPFASASFDIVINVESSHAYGSVPDFLSEVKRVLRKGGFLVLTDFRDKKAYPLLVSQLENCGLVLVEHIDITSHVVKAIEDEDEMKKARIEKHIPRKMQPLFMQFAGVKGSKVHSWLQKGELTYAQFVLRKG